MNQHVPDWTTEGESGCLTDLLPTTNQKNSMGQDNELMELLWRDGHVIMHSQTHRRTPSDVTEFRPTQKLAQSLGNSSNLIQETETSSWFQYTLDDSFEKEFCSEFFSEFANTDTVVSDSISKDLVTEEDRHFKFGSSNESNSFTGITASTSNQCTGTLQESTMPLPRSHLVSSTPQSCLQNGGGVRNFSHFSRSLKADLRYLRCQLGSKASGSDRKVGAQEPSMMTVGSSACESNQIQCHTDASNTLSIDAAGVVAGVKEDTGVRLLLDRRQSKAHEVTVTSSSGGSDCSYGRVRQRNASYQNHKRKERDIEDSGFQSEEADFESNEEKKPAERLISKRRSRAAEVHNLSERRRRDRINEKMKALQKLIPHCNKTDKASMLDEAIEYLKSLQLQVQMMWMGSGMAPMMFPGLQQYVSGIGMGHTSMPAIHSALQLPRVPYVNQSVASTSSAYQTSLFPSSATNAVNFPNQMQMQTIHLPESHARYPGLHMMQPNQAANFSTYGSHMVQQNQSAVTPSSSPLPSAGGPTSSSIRNNKSG